ncbi:MAG: long-chain-fatty-acid--CoA ligase [Chloroflexota bacterium]|nr:long-chain-fatty-acid--CoA ligase [Chloroflexota bacterium]MDE2941795.1 long-chain-fatty-acid--CoA ligase [Chloroflexota bacterium]MDE3267615.1 long-chain-fatty-acid--CoA ligase [Chloroflexota bacterium]
MNTTELLNITAMIVPDRHAIVFDDQRITFGELADRVNRLANGLAELGVGAGDRVAVMQVNCNEHIESYFATAKLDAIFVPINFRARSEELSFMLNDSGVKAIILGQRYQDMLRQVKPELTTLEHQITLEAPADDFIFYDDLIANSSADDRFPTADGEDVTIVMFTAGTTGTPKGVMLSHNSFSSYILANVEPVDMEVAEKNILTVPLHHIAGVQAVMAAIYGGRTLVLQRQFDEEGWMKLVQDEQVNRAMMVPTMLKRLMDQPSFGSYDLSSLQVITYGAAPMPLEVIKKAIAEFPNTRFINAFGQTETASTITMLPPDAHDIREGDPDYDKKMQRLGSIGKPLPDVEVRIVDEDGNDVPLGENGEIVARGERLMKGYWNREEATKETLRGGWLYTGDLGYWDDEGFIFLSGRAKDFLKRGGEMIAPEEVEQIIMSHPAVDEAAIIGVPDIEWGERVRAIVVRKPGMELTMEDVVEHCRPRMAGFKRPEDVIFIDELPRNPMGKVLKRVLREEYPEPIA